tara:strand:+ start:3582 stop:4100 length:519 start_codon:yes stop_codon:yes gene_type:complete
MKILVLANTTEWLERLPKEHEYGVYTIAYGNYLNYYELLTWLRIHNIIKQYEYILVESSSTPNLCFYKRTWVNNLIRSQKDNFEYCSADINFLVWSTDVFDTAQGDQIQHKYDMQLTRPQIDYLQKLVVNNSIDAIMKGSQIRLERYLKRLNIEYNLITDVNNENINIWSAR